MLLSTIDFNSQIGSDIPIEERPVDEVLKMTGRTQNGQVETIDITISGVNAAKPAFDVTTAKFVTDIITDQGIVTPEHVSSFFE